MRGKEELFHQFLRYDRITPAYAGKRPHGGFFCKSLEDPPRLCGEKQNDKNAKANTTGSPPPMRGKGISNLQKEIQRRITPAYAGKRYAGCDFGNVQRDHPRLCGEKLLSIFQKSNHLGSPPPMRGKGNWTRRSTTSMRITPAYAGKSVAGVAVMALGQDHPRLCGEKLLFSPQEM